MKEEKKEFNLIETIENEEALKQLIEDLEIIQENINRITEYENKEIIMIIKKYNIKKNVFIKSRGVLISKIQNFWIETFIQNDELLVYLTENDVEIFKKMKNFYIEENEKDNKFKLIFVRFTFKKGIYRKSLL
jgi:DNA gyrase/topoisomerase IV subunit A